MKSIRVMLAAICGVARSAVPHSLLSAALLVNMAGWSAGQRAHATNDPVKVVLAAPAATPDRRLLTRLRESDSDRLLAAYHRYRLPRQRGGIAMALAYAGGDKAFRALTNTLTVEFAGRTLSGDDASEMFGCLDNLAYLGQEHQGAFEFLKQGTKGETWRRIPHWRHRGESEEVQNYTLASVSIQAIGMTGREEALQWLRKLREENYRFKTHDGEVYSFQSEIVHGALHCYSYTKLGKQEFRAAFWERRPELEKEWLATPDGIDWFRWANPPEFCPSFWKDGKPVPMYQPRERPK